MQPRMNSVQLQVHLGKLCINEHSFSCLAAEAYLSLTLACILLKNIDKGLWCMLNLGLRKVKQETTVLQITSFHWTL